MPLLSTARKVGVLSAPLPVANEHLSRHGVALRQGQFSLLAAAPGVGKSVTATNLVVNTAVSSVYLSADSDEWTVKQRVCSILTGSKLDDVDRYLTAGGKSEAYLIEKLRQADHVDWCYRADIDVEFIALRLMAHTELRGEYPQLLLVDNLTNTVVDQENEYAELRGICRELQSIARNTGAHVMALHHVKGPKEDGFSPIGMADLLGNIGKIPEVVLGLNRIADDPMHLNLTVPKNRGGKAGSHIRIPVDYTKATIGGWHV